MLITANIVYLRRWWRLEHDIDVRSLILFYFTFLKTRYKKFWFTFKEAKKYICFENRKSLFSKLEKSEFFTPSEWVSPKEKRFPSGAIQELQWILKKYIRSRQFPRGLIRSRFDKLTNSDRYWLEFVKLWKWLHMRPRGNRILRMYFFKIHCMPHMTRICV